MTINLIDYVTGIGNGTIFTIYRHSVRALKRVGRAYGTRFGETSVPWLRSQKDV